MPHGWSSREYRFFQAVECLVEWGISPAHLIALKNKEDAVYAFRNEYSLKMKLSGIFEENLGDAASHFGAKGSDVRKYFVAGSKLPVGVLLLHLATISEEALREQWGFWQECIVGMGSAIMRGSIHLPCRLEHLKKFHRHLKEWDSLKHSMRVTAEKLEDADIDWKKVVATIKGRLPEEP